MTEVELVWGDPSLSGSRRGQKGGRESPLRWVWVTGSQPKHLYRLQWLQRAAASGAKVSGLAVFERPGQRQALEGTASPASGVLSSYPCSQTVDSRNAACLGWA